MVESLKYEKIYKAAVPVDKMPKLGFGFDIKYRGRITKICSHDSTFVLVGWPMSWLTDGTLKTELTRIC